MTLSNINKQSINDLQNAYQRLTVYKKWLFPRKLKDILERPIQGELSVQRAFDICHTFLKHTWFFHRWFFNSLSDFDKTPIIYAVKILNRTNLLTGEVGQANFNVIATHQDMTYARLALWLLNKTNLLTGEAGQANFNAIAAHQDMTYAVLALYGLNKANLLTGEAGQANFNAIVIHQNLYHAVIVLGLLNKVNLLTAEGGQANFNAITAHQNLQSVSQVLWLLNEANLLTGKAGQANFNAIIVHQDLRSVNDVLMLLYEANLLSGESRQVNFNNLIDHSTIFFGGAINFIWSQIPAYELTQQRFNELIQIAEQHLGRPQEGQQAVLNYADRVFQIGVGQQPVAPEAAFNPHQSTHTASVHQSVSDSATRLMERYRSNISENHLNNLLKKLETWIKNFQLSSTNQLSAAKKAFQRLMAHPSSFTDPRSKVSTKQLLALAHLAIHDEDNRVGSVEDAKTHVIEGLYECQRGGNLSDIGVDQGEEDRSICAAGTFNKIMEKLAGIHPDVTIQYITLAGASIKLKLLVKEQALHYIHNLPRDESLRLLEEIEKDPTVGSFWEKISAQVGDSLFDEFGSLFLSGREGHEFLKFLSNGKWVELDANFTQQLKKALEEKPINFHSNRFFQPEADSTFNIQNVEERGLQFSVRIK